MKNIVSCFLLLIIVSITVTAAESDFEMADPVSEPAPAYTTIKGRLYTEGSGISNMLIFKDEEGNKYLVKGDQKDILSKLTGIPLVLTGNIIEDRELMYDFQFEVEMFNTHWYKFLYKIQEVSIIGTLQGSNNNYQLVTPCQQIVSLKGNNDYLEDYTGKLVLITGNLERKSEYKAEMSIKSYLGLE